MDITIPKPTEVPRNGCRSVMFKTEDNENLVVTPWEAVLTFDEANEQFLVTAYLELSPKEVEAIKQGATRTAITFFGTNVPEFMLAGFYPSEASIRIGFSD